MSSAASLIGLACVCCVVVSALGIISPNGMTEKTLNLVIGVFIICVMLVPVKNFFTGFDLKLNIPKASESISSQAQNAYNSAVIKECENRLESSLLTSLENCGFAVKKVEIKLGKKRDGGIYIAGINIYIDKGERRLARIISLTEKNFKITPKVIVKQ